MQYGFTMMRIDTKKKLLPGPSVFYSLQDALDDIRFKGWTWYFFASDPDECDSLAVIGHVKDKAVYVFGHDVDGWQRSLDSLPGTLVYIPSDMYSPRRMTSALAAESAIVHRFFQVDV